MHFIPRFAACLAACCAMGCGFGSTGVVRVHDGRARAERFVNDRAYAASLEAAIAEERGDWPAAVASLQRARDEDPDAPDLESRLGLALCHMNKVEAAMFAFEDALRSSEQRERAYTSRAECLMMRGDPVAARMDLMRAIVDEPEALEPALALVEVDLTMGRLEEARARAEEAALLHPSSAKAQRVLAEVLVRAGDVAGAVEAASAASRLDEDEGARARAAVIAMADRSGVAAYALAMRGRRSEPATSFATEIDARCAKLLEVTRQIADQGRAEEIAALAAGVRASCPAIDPEVATLDVEAEWSPKNAETIEARALSSTSSRARRWARRMRLRRLSIDALLASDSLPRADDPPTLALELAVAALRQARSAKPGELGDALSLADVARSFAEAEPTVARLVAEVARLAGKGADDPRRTTACALARTDVEKKACNG
jgi:tetratricopeptide (TPR) repeat protein